IDEVRRLTTKWLILFRNCVAKGREIVFQTDMQSPREDTWEPAPDVVATIAADCLVSAGISGWTPGSDAHKAKDDDLEGTIQKLKPMLDLPTDDQTKMIKALDTRDVELAIGYVSESLAHAPSALSADRNDQLLLLAHLLEDLGTRERQ